MLSKEDVMKKELLREWDELRLRVKKGIKGRDIPIVPTDIKKEALSPKYTVFIGKQLIQYILRKRRNERL